MAMQPTSHIVVETAVQGKDDMIPSWSGTLNWQTAQTSIAISAGSVSAAGIISALQNPLPSPVSASRSVSFTPQTVTVSLPASPGATGHYPVVLQVSVPGFHGFAAQKDDGSRAGGAGGEVTLGNSTLCLWGAIHHTTLSEKRSQSWFDAHPWVPPRNVYTVLVAGSLEYSGSVWQLKLEQAVGQETADGSGWVEPGRWFSRSIFSARTDRFTGNALCFIGDCDYETISGSRLQDTVRVGVSTRYETPLPAAILSDTTATFGAAATGTWHCPDLRTASPFPQYQGEVYAALNVSHLTISTTLSCQPPHPELPDGSISAAEKLTFPGGGCSVTADMPLRYSRVCQLASGELSSFITPWQHFRLETAVSLSEAEITGIRTEASLTTGAVKHRLTARISTAREQVSCSYSASAKW